MSRIEEAAWVVAGLSVAVAVGHAVLCRCRRMPPTAWPVAAGVLLAAFTTTGAGVRLTEGSTVANSKRAVAIAEQIEKARGEQRAGRFEAALAEWVKADRMGGDPAECLVRAAECNLYLNKPFSAILYCDWANSRSPRCGLAYHVRGLAYQSQGKHREAAEQYEIGRAYGCRASELILKAKPKGA